MKLFFDLLQNRNQFIKEILDGTGLKRKAMQLGLLSAATFGLYGLIIGSQHSFRQALSSGFKLPILFLLTNAICVPALFVRGHRIPRNKTCKTPHGCVHDLCLCW